MRLTLCLLVTALVALLAAVAPAAADHEPLAFSDARRGDLRVVSGAFVTARSAQLMGTWFDDTISCREFRSLRVTAFIDYTRRRTSRIVTGRRTGAVRNCAEGGPNFGFDFRANRFRLACPNGRWKPGFYTFHVRTTHRATGLQASVTLLWTNRARC